MMKGLVADNNNTYETNSVVKDALSQNFDVLDNDPAITAFEIMTPPPPFPFNGREKICRGFQTISL